MSIEEINTAIAQLSPEDLEELTDWLEQKRSRSSQSKSLRPYGLAAGEFVVPKDFDAPLPDEGCPRRTRHCLAGLNGAKSLRD